MRLSSLSALAVVTACLAQGCASVGTAFDFRGPKSVVVGKTTQDDVRATYGTPFRVGYENGHTKWTYGFYQYGLKGNSTKDLDIVFDKQGVVMSYAYSSSSPDEVRAALR